MARGGGGGHLLATLLVLLLLATLLLSLLLAAPLAVAASATAAEADPAPPAPAQSVSEAAEADLLPRPLVIELPSARAAHEPAAGAEAQADLAPAQGGVPEAAADADTLQQHHLLPRPLVIELPSERAAGDEPGADAEFDSLPTDVRCASWRLAAEANNLAPWKAVPAECAPHVRDYVTGPAYRSDLEVVARESAAYARAVAPLANDGRGAWVFDIDETLLSNLPYYAEHGYGAELFDHHKFDEWVERGEAAAIRSSLRLYNEVRELGFKTFLLTGRCERHRVVTVENLNKQGFHDWEKLILRAAGDRNKTATLYKSEKRKEIEEEGYRILGNSGDQWSDLLGSSMSVRSFKLPNPMYYIP